MLYLNTLLCLIFFSLAVLKSHVVSAQSLHLNSFDSEHGLSQNSINCSLTDAQGFQWFATQGGLNRFDGYEFKRFKAHTSATSISGNWITACLKGTDNDLWFSTASKGLNRLDPTTGQFYTYSTFTNPQLSDDKIWSLAFDKSGNMWLGHEQGTLSYFDIAAQQFETYQVAENTQQNIVIRDIIAVQNTLWLATSHGLLSFNPKTKQFKHDIALTSPLWHLNKLSSNQLLIGAKQGLYIFSIDTETSSELPQFKGVWITDSLLDNQHNLWLTSYGQGVYFLAAGGDIHTDVAHYRHDVQKPNGLKNDYLLSLYQDPQGIIWIGTDGFGIHRYDPKQQQFGHQSTTSSPHSLTHNFIRAIIKRKNGQLWVGTREGLNRAIPQGYQHYTTRLPNTNIFSLHEDKRQQLWVGTYGGGLLKYQDESDDFVSYTMQSHQLSSDRVYAIESDKDGIVWLGSNQGLTRFDPDSETVTHYQHNATHNSLANNTVFTLAYDKNDHALWVGTRAGLNKFSIETEQFTLLNERTGLSHNMVTSLLLSDDKTLWVGTMQGLNKVNKQNFDVEHISEQHGLVNDNIFDILADKQGYLWLATNGGLTRYHPITGSIQPFLPEDGIQHQSFILGASFQAIDGELFFGGINGFNQFYPDKLTLDHTPPTPVLTELLLNNREISTDFFDHSTDTLINATNTFSFAKSAGVIGFKFSALNNAATPKHYQYGYKLAGFDQQFLYNDASQRQINYPQLPAGHYQLQLKVRDQYGQWSEDTTLLELKVVPPWWQSNVAYISYTLCAMTLAWLVISSIYQRKLAEQQKQKEIELNKLKDQFLDNISHELKTPLSLILAPISQLQQSTHSSKAQSQLASIKRNCQRLLDLINQLLQLSKRPSTAVHYVSAYSLTTFLTDLIDDFAPLFAQKQLKFNFQDHCETVCTINIAPNHAHSIVSNLISNALKYTPAGGEVRVCLHHSDNLAHISVSDTGIGIAKDQQVKIFERFTRLDTCSETGSGIGLTLVKQLVEDYGGEISLTSSPAQGSCFTVSLPTVISATKQNLPTVTTQPGLRQTLMIVEDNSDMSELLLSLFSEQFNCICACDGQQALSLCQSELPDLIISDVMMPNMDGYQMLAKLRADNATSHIPVLLLSAKADTPSRLKGLDLLADDFLSKPFEPSILLSKVKGLLSLRYLLNQHLAAQLTSEIQNDNNEYVTVQTKDSVFTEKLKKVVRENYQSDQFSIEQLASALCLSPRALQLKMKALYSLTPSDYLRNTRIEYAAKQLIESSLAIGLIAENNGFSSQSYFARSFKGHFGVSPKQYREKHQKQPDFRLSE